MTEAVRVGLIGENPNDTESLIHLLRQKFDRNIDFFSMLNNVNGSYLDDKNFARFLRVEISQLEQPPNIIIAIRDLDGLAHERDKVRLVQEFFAKVRSAFNQSSKSSRRISGKPKSANRFCFLLCIYEYEALIFADIEIFNREYKTSLSCENPETIANPKELLQNATLGTRYSGRRGAYQENHCRWLFPLLRIDIVAQNSTQFRKFLEQLDKAISTAAADN